MSLIVSLIQRNSIKYGTGIRTTIFFKGCTLGCNWCTHTESISPQPEILFKDHKCISCGLCTKNCPIELNKAQGITFKNWKRCQQCFRCVDVCPTKAITRLGEYFTINDIYKAILRDRHFYRLTNGGVTYSGGEPLLQSGPLLELLKKVKTQSLHNLIQTTGNIQWDNFEQVMPFVDQWFFDLRAGDPELHKKIIGGDPKLIWENAKKLVTKLSLESAKKMVNFRMPLIPQVNDCEESIYGISNLLHRIQMPKLTLLPYKKLEENKFEKVFTFNSADSRSCLSFQKVKVLFENLGIDIQFDHGLFDFKKFGDFHNLQHKNNKNHINSISGCTKNYNIKNNKKEKDQKSNDENILSERIKKLLKEYFSIEPGICSERSTLVHQYFANPKNKDKPRIIQRSESLVYILLNSTPRIYEDELLVGSWNTKRIGGAIYPEMNGIMYIIKDLFKFQNRKVNPFRINNQNKIAFLKNIPFWSSHSLVSKAISTAGLKAGSLLYEYTTQHRYVINEFGGIGHLCPNYEQLLKLGIMGYTRLIENKIKSTDDLNRKIFYRSLMIICDGIGKWAEIYSQLSKKLALELKDGDPRKKELIKISKVCKRVPMRPAKTFHQALQSILFLQIAINLESSDNSIGLGRLDQILYPYYKNDLENNIITRQQAVELLCCFSIKLSELVPVYDNQRDRIHGGHCNGQSISIGGLDSLGNDSTNELTMIFLNIMNKLRIRQPNYWARVHPNSPVEYLNEITSNLMQCSPSPSLVNDSMVQKIFNKKGVEKRDIWNYSAVGSCELIPNSKAYGSTNAAMINVVYALELSLGLKNFGHIKNLTSLENVSSMEQLFENFAHQLDHLIHMTISDLKIVEQIHSKLFPTPLTSLLVDGCINSGIDVTSGGAKYVWSGIQGIGIPDVADSLMAIDHIIFKDKRSDLKTLIKALKNNFQENKILRQYLINSPKYGHDNSKVDKMVYRIMKIFNELLNRRINTRKGKYCAGFSSETVHEHFGLTTSALPNGCKRGSVLANGLSPKIYNNDFYRSIPTKSLKSLTSLHLLSAENGLSFNLSLNSNQFQGDNGYKNLSGLIKGYFKSGGVQLQINLLNIDILKDAFKYPNKYPHLLVPLSGNIVYFNDLTKNMKLEIINRIINLKY
ncbi:formate acetyltransferase 3-related [Anaeramoeba flamelloides]|uniref:Formate acetyltransferase 3-related n=1 Tax=Anaeramoeba flamelloides TaxID=1746091 RepID=A0AAV7YEK9_9EUKA|nr:formate acetyltransferase 3-related [Anaeramoeba flamelloides]